MEMWFDTSERDGMFIKILSPLMDDERHAVILLTLLRLHVFAWLLA